MPQANQPRPRAWCLSIFLSINLVLQSLGYIALTGFMVFPSLADIQLSGLLVLGLYVTAMLLGVALVLGAIAWLYAGFLSRDASWLPLYLLWCAVETFVISYLFVDSMVYRIMGLHLDSHFILEAFLNKGFQKEAQISAGTWALLLAGIGLALFLQMMLLRFCLRLVARQKHLRPRLAGFGLAWGVLFVILLAWGLYQRPQLSAQHPKVTSALPFYQKLFRGTAVVAASRIKVHYPIGNARTHKPTLKKKYNILFVMVESLRSDMLNARYMPHATRFIEQHNCIRSKRHYSGGHSTTWGVFSMFYGLHSYHMRFLYNQNTPPYPLQVLKHNGYQLEGYSASRLKGWDHGEMFGQHLDRYGEELRGKSYENDRKMVEITKDMVKRIGTSKPFFLFLFLDSTHHNYLYPPGFAKFQPTMPENYNHFMVNHKLRKLKHKVFNRYKNSVRYVDHTFHQLMKAMQSDIKRDNLIVALVGDHGEEFWEHGFLGHGAPRMINQRTQVPLLLCIPKIKSRTVALSGHSDIWPTVLDALQPSTPLPPASYSTGHSLLRPLPKDRYTITTSYGFPYKNRRLGMVTQQHKMWVDVKGALDQIDVTRVTDLEDHPRSLRLTPQMERDIDHLKRDMHRFLRPDTLKITEDTRVQHKVDAQFGPYLRLVGYDMPTKTLSPGQTVLLTYYFQALKKTPRPWQIFVHLSYRKGSHKDFRNLQFQSMDGQYALSLWKKGQYAKETQRVHIPQSWSPGGHVSLFIGMWAPKLGRQPVALQAGAPARKRYKKSLTLFRIPLVNKR